MAVWLCGCVGPPQLYSSPDLKISLCLYILYICGSVERKCEKLVSEEGGFFVKKPSLLPRKRRPFFVQIKTFVQRIFGKGSGLVLEKAGVAKLFKGVRQS